MIEHYGWKLPGVENTRGISENETFGDVVEDMVVRSRKKPSATLFETIHSHSYYVN